jgi:carotenoid 1,2-hydratase
MNVALYGPRGKRWAMTERGRGGLHRTAASLSIGASQVSWDNDSLTVQINETAAPLPLPIRGTVRLCPADLPDYSATLDAEGRHRWRPIAPSARVEVSLQRPSLRWFGSGYLDTNDGDVPLEQDFVAWNWSRAQGRNATAILYDGQRRSGDRFELALAFDAAGRHRPIQAPPHVRLPTTRWRIPRSTRVDAQRESKVLRTLEDTPFYARSLLATHLLGEPMLAVHESLSLEQFQAPWVQILLPFRMPRRGR